MAPHSSTLAWKIPWMEEPDGLQSMGSLKVGHNWATSLSRIGEGNGNPLQCSCLENPRDGGAWWAAVYGVAQSRTRLKRLSSSSSIYLYIYIFESLCCTPELQHWNQPYFSKENSIFIFYNYLFWTALYLCCCQRAVAESSGVLSCCGTWASQRGGFFCWERGLQGSGLSSCGPRA